MKDFTMAAAAGHPASPRLGPEELAAPLSSLLGSRFGRGESLRMQFLASEGLRSTTPPWAVAQPASVDEIQAIHRLCHKNRTPLIPFGSGSSVEGQVAAEPGSLVIDLRGLNEILEIDAQSMTARVQAGVTRLQLDAALKNTGLFFPVDPGADATIGGMAATRASGTNAVRYGTMRENTLGLQAVLADGELIKCGSATAKASNGYDLLHLFVGSEGTLGTIVELTVRLFPRPETVAGAVFSFPDIESAVAAVTDFRSAGIPIARVELLDATTVGALNNYANLGLPDAHLLMVELHGSASSVLEQFEAVASLAAEYPGTRQMYADDATRRAELWAACHKRYYACRALRPGARAIATDVCVPLAWLAETVEATLADITRMPIPVTLHGHVGDGNFHTVVLYDENSAEEVRALDDYCERLALRAILNGGTCSGEHGIGIGKQRYLRQEHGNALDWMQRIKQLFDPFGIMNPGKNVDVR
jgi:D-lactate dehydrogenase (cytochrome)